MILLKKKKNKTIFTAVIEEDFINKDCLDENLSQIDGHLSFLGKSFNQYKILTNKQSIEEILIQRAVRPAIQILYDKDCLIIFSMKIRF